MKTLKRISALLVFGALLFSCSKKDDYLKWSDISSSGGSITVKMTGVSADTISVNENLVADKFSSLSPTQEAFYIKDVSGSYYFDITRSFDKMGYNTVDLSFNRFGTTITNSTLDLSYEKKLANGKVLEISQSSIPLTITNCTFDATTGVLKGSYTGKIGTGANSINLSGDFNATVTQTVN